MRKIWKERIHNYALGRVRKVPNPVLRKTAKHSRAGIIAWLRERRLLFVFRHQENALGMAAPQIGCSRMIFVVRNEQTGNPMVFHNPIVESLDARKEHVYEGCLSIPGGLVDVERAAWVRIDGENAWGQRLPALEATGLFAAMLQHENDHLNGVLITDYGPLINDEEYGKIVVAEDSER
jgi:peptide deformylase